MMSIRRLLKTFIISISSVIGIAIVLQTICFVRMDDERIRKDINHLFMDRLGKAVKFDSARVYFWGRMSLSNFTLSRSSDFNDNLPLLKCDSAVVQIRLIDLLRKRINVKSIGISKGVVSLQKQSDEGLKDFFDSLIPDNDKGADIGSGFDFDMLLDDVSLNLKVFTVNEVVLFQAEDISSRIRCGRNSISWEMEGDVLPRIPGIKTGEMKTEGAVYIYGNKIHSGKIAFGLNNVDLGYFSPMVNDNLGAKITINGTGDLSSVIAFVGNSCSFSNTCVLNDLKVVNTQGNKKLIDRDMISLHASGEYVSGGKIRVRNFSVNDGNVSMRGSVSMMVEARLIKSIAGRLKVDPLDMSDFCSSYPFVPIRGKKIEGSFSCDGYLSYDRVGGTCDLIKGVAGIRKLVISSGTGEGAEKYLDGNLSAVCTDESVIMDSSGKHMGEPYEVNAKLFMRKMRPFSNAIAINASFQRGSMEIMMSLINGSLRGFFEKVYEDRSGGYEDIKFLETFAGRMVNNNDIGARLKIARISVGTNGGGFTDFDSSLTLNGGMLKCEMSSLKGFDAKYSLAGDGALRSDYPQMKISGNVTDFNLQKYAAANGIKGIKDGKFSMSVLYSVNGNRLAHFVDNGTVDFTMEVTGLVVDGNGYADSFAKYLRTYLPSVDFSTCAISQGGFAYHQTGENGSVQKFSVTSDRGNLSGFGKYTYEKGLNISGEFSASAAGGSFARAPFDITGTLASPVFQIRDKKSDNRKTGSFILF